MPFLNVNGKWFPLESVSARKTESGEEIEVWDLEATLFHQGDDMAEALNGLLRDYVEEMRPMVGRDEDGMPSTSMPTGGIIAQMINTNLSGPAHRNDTETFAEFINIEPTIMAHMMLQFLGPDPDHLTDRDRRAVVEFANVLGPDWAQKLYHFAVKVTKIV